MFSRPFCYMPLSAGKIYFFTYRSEKRDACIYYMVRVSKRFVKTDENY